MKQIVHNCRKCGVELNDDNWTPTNKKGGSCICKECVKEYGCLYREANRDKIKAQNNLYREANRDKIKTQSSLYREINRDEIKERARLRIEANIDKIIDFDGKVCRKCGVELDSENWSPSRQKDGNYICKGCAAEQARLYREANPEKAIAAYRLWCKNNPEKAKEYWTKGNRKRGNLPMGENKECSSYLGVHVNERLLKHYFNDVEMMPYGHPGYDFICNNGKKVDGKSSCLHKNGRWTFNIKCNTIPDYFFCVAYDNRDDLNPVHIWMLPGKKFNHLKLATIRPSTIEKWAEYEQDISKVVICCDEIKSD